MRRRSQATPAPSARKEPVGVASLRDRAMARHGERIIDDVAHAHIVQKEQPLELAAVDPLVPVALRLDDLPVGLLQGVDRTAAPDDAHVVKRELLEGRIEVERQLRRGLDPRRRLDPDCPARVVLVGGRGHVHLSIPEQLLHAVIRGGDGLCVGVDSHLVDPAGRRLQRRSARGGLRAGREQGRRHASTDDEESPRHRPV